jgi:hypothetical protein
MEYCFFTPSYRNDIERVEILRQSINHFVKESLIHYVVVPKQDFFLFKKRFSNEETVIILKQNDFVNSQFYATKLHSLVNYFLPSQSWRLSNIAGRPGWIVQQIVKLSIPDIVQEDAAIILDSDMFFIKHFSIYDIFPQSIGRVLARRHPLTESGMHRKHITKAREILKLPHGDTSFHYNSTFPAIWYKDYIVQLQAYLTQTYNQPWQNSLFEAGIISEYNLYGIYIEEIVKPINLKLIKQVLEIGMWEKKDFERFISDDFQVDKEKFCIVVQSNLGLSVNEYQQQINNFLDKN